MFTDAYKKAEDLEKEVILQEVLPLLDGDSYSVENTEILSKDLSFYPGHKLLEISRTDNVPKTYRYIVLGPKDNIALDWTNEPIYQLNQTAPLTLNENTVQSYVRFFFHYVKGKEGRFIITETTDDILWREEPPPSARQAVGKMLEPVSIIEAGEDGSFKVSICIMFKDSLFKSDVFVQQSGVVNLENERLLVESMPILDDVIGQ